MKQSQWIHLMGYLEKALLSLLLILTSSVSASPSNSYSFSSCFDALTFKSIGRSTSESFWSPNHSGINNALSGFETNKALSGFTDTNLFLKNIFFSSPHYNSDLTIDSLTKSTLSMLGQDPLSNLAIVTERKPLSVSISWKQDHPMDLTQKEGLLTQGLQKALFECYKAGGIFCQLRSAELKNNNLAHENLDLFLNTVRIELSALKSSALLTHPVVQKNSYQLPQSKTDLDSVFSNAFLKALMECQKLNQWGCLFGSSYVSNIDNARTELEISSVFVSIPDQKYLSQGQIFSVPIQARSNEDSDIFNRKIAHGYYAAITKCYEAGFTICAVTKLITQEASRAANQMNVYVEGRNISLPEVSSKGNLVDQNL